MPLEDHKKLAALKMQVITAKVRPVKKAFLLAKIRMLEIYMAFDDDHYSNRK